MQLLESYSPDKYVSIFKSSIIFKLFLYSSSINNNKSLSNSLDSNNSKLLLMVLFNSLIGVIILFNSFILFIISLALSLSCQKLDTLVSSFNLFNSISLLSKSKRPPDIL